VSLANLDELSLRLGVDLDPESAAAIRAQTALDDATVLVERAAGTQWDEDSTLPPDVGKMIVLRAAARAMASPEGAMPDVSLLPDELEILREVAGHSVHSLELESGYGLRWQSTWFEGLG
jgi:hypothetical protein